MTEMEIPELLREPVVEVTGRVEDAEISPTIPETEYLVHVKGHTRGTDEILPILNAYARKIKKNIVCVNGRGREFGFDSLKEAIKYDGIPWGNPGETLLVSFRGILLNPDGTFDNAVVDTNDGIPHTFKLFDKYLPIEYEITRSSNLGIDLKDDNGIRWGELIVLANEPILTIGCELLTREDSRALLIDCLDSLDRYIDSDWDNVMAKAALAEVEKNRVLYAQACTSRYRLQIVSAQDQKDNAQRLLLEQQRYIRDAVITLENAKHALRSAKILANADNRDIGKFYNEFDALIANPKIRSVSAHTDTVTIETEELNTVVLRDGSTRMLGAYKITFYVNSAAEPEIINMTRVINGAVHPHIQSGPCWGNMTEAITLLVQTKEYAAAMAMIIHFFENVNDVDDWGRSVFNWPINTETPGQTAFDGTEDQMDAETCGYCGEYYSDCSCCSECNDSGMECNSYDCNSDNECPCIWGENEEDDEG